MICGISMTLATGMPLGSACLLITSSLMAREMQKVLSPAT